MSIARMLFISIGSRKNDLGMILSKIFQLIQRNVKIKMHIAKQYFLDVLLFPVLVND